jgi:CheY-like chemotaxis protein
MIMPGMSGSETYNQIKNIHPDVKVLLSSGYSISGEATEILNRVVMVSFKTIRYQSYFLQDPEIWTRII